MKESLDTQKAEISRELARVKDERDRTTASLSSALQLAEQRANAQTEAVASLRVMLTQKESDIAVLLTKVDGKRAQVVELTALLEDARKGEHALNARRSEEEETRSSNTIPPPPPPLLLLIEDGCGDVI